MFAHFVIHSMYQIVHPLIVTLANNVLKVTSQGNKDISKTRYNFGSIPYVSHDIIFLWDNVLVGDSPEGRFSQ